MESFKLKASNKNVLTIIGVTLAVMMMPSMAFAQSAVTDGSGIFCWIAQYFKQIVGAAALVAIFMWAIEHIFGAAKLHDVVIKVGVSCGIVIAGAAMVAKSGLTTCSGM